MNSSNQSGFVSGTLISLIVTITLLVGALGFGGWAFLSRSDYKNNSDQKATKAADERQTATEAADEVKYAEEAKNPLKTHKAPDQYGGVTVAYPKTWSGYVSESGNGSTVVDDYFHPDVVPSTTDKSAVYALHIQVVAQAYDLVVGLHKSSVLSGKLVATPFALPKIPSIIGTRFTGQLETNKQGSLVVLPMRNLTLEISTESGDFLPDFNNIILPNMSFAP